MSNPARQQRLFNVRRIIAAVSENPGVTRAEIARRFQLSKPAVSDIIRVLIEAEVVEEDGVQASSRKGRNPIRLKLASNAYQILSVDLGGTNLRGAALNLKGDVLHRFSEMTRSKDLEDQIVQLVARLIQNGPKTRILGIGIGAAGTVEQPSAKILNMPALGRRNVELANVIAREFKLPILVDNDVNYAALGEWWRGAAQQKENVICISIGTGIGSGLILNGQLYRGSHNLVGEIGYFYRGETLPDRPYQTFGAMEHRAGGWGIQQRALKRLEEGTDSLLSVDSINKQGAKAILHASLQGDELAREIVRDVAFEIGVAVANVISLLDLDRVVLLGGIMGTPEGIIPIVEEVIRYVTVPEARNKVDIRLGELGNDAVLIGAAYHVQEALLPAAVVGANAEDL